MTRRRRNGLVAAGIVAVLALAWAVLGGSGLAVTVAEARRDTLSVSVEEEGRMRARDRYTVAAPITGRLSRTSLEEGSAVSPGDVLVTLAPPPEDPRSQAAAQAAVASAEARRLQAAATLGEAETSYEQAAREVERRRPLVEQGALSRESFERFELAAATARARLESARASLSAAQAEVRAARAGLLGAEIEGAQEAAVAVRAPVGGVVLAVLEESERVVPAGTPLFEIAAPEGLEVVVDLLTEEAVAVRPGDPLRVTDWGGEETLEGAVRYVEPSAFTEVSALGVEEQRVNVIGDLAWVPPSLGAGFRVEAAIVTWSGTDVLSIPTSAVFQRGSGTSVFVAEGGRARLRAVEIGHRGSERVEVVAGLEEGEDVILFPSDLVEEGVRVDPAPGPMPPS